MEFKKVETKESNIVLVGGFLIFAGIAAAIVC